MFIEWDYGTGQPIGSPSNLAGEGDNWVACEMPGRRKSKAQKLVWEMTEDANGYPLAVASWQGSDDPKAATASNQVIRAAWLELMQFPIETNDGYWFQFDEESERIMRKTIRALTLTGSTESWRLQDNTVVPVDAAGLQAYYDELEDLQALRGLQLNQEYLNFKQNGATLQEVEDWKLTYSAPSGS